MIIMYVVIGITALFALAAFEGSRRSRASNRAKNAIDVAVGETVGIFSYLIGLLLSVISIALTIVIVLWLLRILNVRI